MDTVALVGRLLVSLAAVLGVMWLLARRMRKGARGKDSRLIDILGRQQLSRNASVAVVRIGDQALVIGVTDSQVSVLGDTDLGAAQAMVAAPQSASPKRGTAARAVPLSSARGRHADIAAGIAVDTEEPVPSRKPLAGSALSPQTWRQAVESLRDITSRPA